MQAQYEFDDIHGKWGLRLCLIMIYMELAVGAGGTGGEGWLQADKQVQVEMLRSLKCRSGQSDQAATSGPQP